MRYQEIITERRQQRTEIMYHGTSSNLVPNILKHGLLARPPRKTYDVDTYGAATASMGGVYVADDPDFAKLIADEAVGTHGGEPALVTIQYVRGSSDLDEDSIVAAISDAAKQVMKQIGNKYPPLKTQKPFGDFYDEPESSEYDRYNVMSYPQEGWAAEQMIQNPGNASKQIADATMEILSRKSKPTRAARGIIQQMAQRLLQHASKQDGVRDRWHALAFDAFDIMRETQEDLLAKLMKQVSPDIPGRSEETRRIDRDVKFRGKTRILKIQIGDRVVYPPEKTDKK